MSEEEDGTKRAKAYKTTNQKKRKAATDDDKENEKKKARSTSFTEEETDLLLSLLMASDLLSQVTNKITPYGRIKSWQDLHRIFNSSPEVHQREEKVLRARVHNIRTGLGKLSAFSKSVVSATGGGLLPPSNPPTVPFKLTPIVRQYAAVIAIKISGLAPCGDSDGPTSSQVAPSFGAVLQSPSLAPSNCIALSNLDLRTHSNLEETVLLAVPLSSEEELVYEQTPSPSTSGKQFFPTTRQQLKPNVSSGRKREVSSNNQNLYFKEKATLVAAEIARRTELHALDIKKKQEELVTQQHMTAFWQLATQRLKANEIRIGDIIPVAMMQPSLEDN